MWQYDGVIAKGWGTIPIDRSRLDAGRSWHGTDNTDIVSSLPKHDPKDSHVDRMDMDSVSRSRQCVLASHEAEWVQNKKAGSDCVGKESVVARVIVVLVDWGVCRVATYSTH